MYAEVPKKSKEQEKKTHTLISRPPQMMVHIQNTQKMWQFPTKYRVEENPESQFILCLIIKKSIVLISLQY